MKKGTYHTKEAINKMRLGHIGKVSPMLGKYHTEESNLKNRLAHLGKSGWNKGLTKETDERVRKISLTHIGKKHPKKTKKIMSKVRLKGIEEGKIKIWNKGKTSEEDNRILSKENHPRYNKHHTKEALKKIGLSSKGNKHRLGSKHTKEARNKIRLGHIGKPTWNKGLSGNEYLKHYKDGEIKSWNRGKTFEEDNRIPSGENHPHWLGGISFEPYGLEFNKQLKEFIRKRDNYRCQECGFTQEQLKKKLDVHHIDFCKTNNNPNNLISLCKSCHIQTNFNREEWTNYFQDKISKG